MTKRKRVKADLKTAEEVRDEFDRTGQSITDWAATHGYKPNLVYEILTGKRRCKRGQSHEIAVLLGIKDGVILQRVSR